MADIPLTQEQRDALHARGLNDEAISFLKSAEEADQIIRNVTPERAQEIFRKAALELSSQVPPPERDNKVIHLAERAQEVLEITELEPAPPKFFAGKYINPDGTMTAYKISDGDRDQHIKHWWQRVVRVPATIPHLFAYTRAAQKRNVCLIRGTAVRAFEGLFSADGLKDARARAPRMNEANPAFIRVFYQRAGAGCKPTDAMFLKGVANPRGWLEERLGALAWFKVQQEEGKDEAV